MRDNNKTAVRLSVLSLTGLLLMGVVAAIAFPRMQHSFSVDKQRRENSLQALYLDRYKFLEQCVNAPARNVVVATGVTSTRTIAVTLVDIMASRKRWPDVASMRRDVRSRYPELSTLYLGRTEDMLNVLGAHYQALVECQKGFPRAQHALEMEFNAYNALLDSWRDYFFGGPLDRGDGIPMIPTREGLKNGSRALRELELTVSLRDLTESYQYGILTVDAPQ